MSVPKAQRVAWTLSFAALACVGIGVIARADDATDEARARFDAELRSVYDYLPADVEQDVRDAKVAEMERFWEFVKADVATYRPLLRAALTAPDQNRYFLFDGAGLLAEIAEGPADIQAAADATARCRIADVGPPGYFRFVMHLGIEGADTTDAALQILDDPKFAVYLPAHAMTLRQAQCLQLCLMTTDESVWVPKALARFESETGTTARRTLLRALAFAVRPDADAAIRAVAENDDEPDRMLSALAKGVVRRARIADPKGTPTTSREQFESVLAACAEDGRVPYSDAAQAAIADALHHVRRNDEALLRRARCKIARRVSDESLLELTQVTTWLRRATAFDD